MMQRTFIAILVSAAFGGSAIAFAADSAATSTTTTQTQTASTSTASPNQPASTTGSTSNMFGTVYLKLKNIFTTAHGNTETNEASEHEEALEHVTTAGDNGHHYAYGHEGKAAIVNATGKTDADSTQEQHTYKKGITTGTSTQYHRLDGDEFQNRPGIVTANGAPGSIREQHEEAEYRPRVTSAAGNGATYHETGETQWRSHIVTASGSASNGAQYAYSGEHGHESSSVVTAGSTGNGSAHHEYHGGHD